MPLNAHKVFSKQRQCIGVNLLSFEQDSQIVLEANQSACLRGVMTLNLKTSNRLAVYI